jgi:D-alanine-D-alanine ligase
VVTGSEVLAVEDAAPRRIAALVDPEIDPLILGGHRAPLDTLEAIDWHVIRALRSLGHDVRVVTNSATTAAVIDRLITDEPDLVFNLTVRVAGRDDWAPHVPALLDLLRFRYTGATSAGLMLGCHKAVSKSILRDCGVRVPDFASVPIGHRPPPTFSYPAIVKALWAGGSTGMLRASLVHNADALLRQVRRMHESVGVDAICETYVEGVEVSVLMVERDDGPAALFLTEAVFSGDGAKALSFKTERAKWDAAYRSRVGLWHRPACLPEAIENEVVRVAGVAFRTLGMRDYGKVDVRIDGEGSVYVLDTNPNCALRPADRRTWKSAPSFVRVINHIISRATTRSA